MMSDLKKFFLVEGEADYLNLGHKIRVIVFSYGLHAIAVYRFGYWINSLPVRPLLSPLKSIALIFCHCLNFVTRILYGIHIAPKASIGKGFYIGHFGGIFIGPCRIGRNCSIHQQVCIGQYAPHNQSDETWIGNNVWIGSHATISAGVRVEDNVTIAAGSVVKSDVKRGNLVMGDPARVISRNYNNKSLLGIKNSEPYI